MNKRRKTVFRWLASLLATLCFAAGVSASTSNWMQREGTIGHALTLDDGAKVYLDAVLIGKIRAKLPTPYFTVYEPYNSKDTLIVLTPPSPELRMGMTVDIEGALTTLPNKQRAIISSTVWGYTSKQGALLRHPPLIKGMLRPTPWQWKADLTVAAKEGTSVPTSPSAIEPNADPPDLPVFYAKIPDAATGPRAQSNGDFIDLAEFQCKPIVATGSDPTYGPYFVLGEDHSPETLRVYCRQCARSGDRINKISGQLHYEGTIPVLCVDAGPGYDYQVYEGRAEVVGGRMGGGEVRTLTDDPPTGSIAYAKTFADSESVTITGKIVSATRTDFPNALYVQEPNRVGGIRILYTGSLQPARGDAVNVSGTIGTGAYKEREINAGTSGVTYVNHPGEPVRVGMPNRSLGGADFNIYTPGVNCPTGSGTGLHNKGLLVNTWGRATAVDAANKYFYIDDGAGFQDGSGNTGVKVSWDWSVAGKPSVMPPAVGWYVCVTGVSGSETSGDDCFRALRVRDQSDVYPLPDATAPIPGVASSPPYVSSNPITVTYSGASDDVSGLKKVELWYKKGIDGTWTYSAHNLSSASSGSFAFTPTNGAGTYYFDLVAEDNADNRSAQAADEGDCSTIYTAGLDGCSFAAILIPPGS